MLDVSGRQSRESTNVYRKRISEIHADDNIKIRYVHWNYVSIVSTNLIAT